MKKYISLLGIALCSTIGLHAVDGATLLAIYHEQAHKSQTPNKKSFSQECAQAWKDIKESAAFYLTKAHSQRKVISDFAKDTYQSARQTIDPYADSFMDRAKKYGSQGLEKTKALSHSAFTNAKELYEKTSADLKPRITSLKNSVQGYVATKYNYEIPILITQPLLALFGKPGFYTYHYQHNQMNQQFDNIFENKYYKKFLKYKSTQSVLDILAKDTFILETHPKVIEYLLDQHPSIKHDSEAKKRICAMASYKTEANLRKIIKAVATYENHIRENALKEIDKAALSAKKRNDNWLHDLHKKDENWESQEDKKTKEANHFHATLQKMFNDADAI